MKQNPTRAWITRAARVGIPDYQIAFALGMTREELHLLYSQELKTSALSLNLNILETLARLAQSGKSVFATIFWVKNRCWHHENSSSAKKEKEDPYRNNIYNDFIVTGPNGETE